jgi:16S rRNA (guanine527-N7)-methyltransferase
MSATAAVDLSGAKWRLQDWFGDKLTKKHYEDLRKFHVELFNFSTKMNLVSLSTLNNSDQMHFADCIQASQIILNDFKGKRLTDIGSGNGFPGIVLAVLDRTMKISFIESRGKRVEFLKHVASRLELANVEVIHTRVEDLEEGSATAGVSRAFANLPNALLTTRKTFAPGSDYYHMKSDGWATEVANLPHQLCSTWNIVHLGDYVLPETSLDRTVIKAVKT